MQRVGGECVPRRDSVPGREGGGWKAEQERELLKLSKKITTLRLQISRYEIDIERLQEERDILEEKVANLEQSLAVRDYELRDIEALLNLKERQIAFL